MKNFLIFVLVVLVLGGGYFYFTKSSMNQPLPDKTTTTVVSDTVSTTTSQTYNISIDKFAYDQKSITINKGDTIIWKNIDRVPHDVVGTTFKDLKSPIMGYGLTYSYTFNEAGTFEYFCSLHPSMKAVVIVK